MVCGRGVGKTHGCAYELIQLVMASPPGSEGAVLAPTLTHAEAAISKLREIAEPLGQGVRWVQGKRLLHLPGDRSIKVFSADRKEVVRGPSLVALWVDEGAYISSKAIEASLPALRAVGRATWLLISTTPAGKNWVWDWWRKAGEPGSLVERFRFKGTDSPFQDQAVIALARETMSPEKFAQEYGAAFVDNLILVFPEREKLFVPAHPPRAKAPRCWVGVDIGQQDYTVCTLMNEWGEGEVLDRWNVDTPGYKAAAFWAQTHDRIAQLCKARGAVAVVDTGGAGGAPGAVLAERLRAEKLTVLEIKTSSQGTKAQIVEQAQVDVQHQKVTILENQHSPQLDYEMARFQGIKRVIHGREINAYEGPQVPGEHDDCVIAFCLANWGRVHGDTPVDPLAGDFTGFEEGTELKAGAPPAGGEFGDWGP